MLGRVHFSLDEHQMTVIIICLCQRKQDDNVRVQLDYPDDISRNEPIEMKSQWEPCRDSARQNIGRMSWGDQVDNHDC